MRERRQDIDLLRSVAVLAVLFFHFDVPGFSGGFLGVDIFFVISGYLITLHIQEQIADSSFSFPEFYLRRIRRLFPALFATLIATSFAAIFILPKQLLFDFSSSQIASAVYVSNIYFWSIAGYFDTDSIVKPLLHTWSLSVEEQFYLVWPLFIVLCFHRQLKLAILIAFLASIIGAEIIYDFSPSSAFYLFPFRIFEFSVGAIISGITLSHLPLKVRHLILTGSVIVIFYTLISATEHSRHPGLLTLPLCISVAMIIAIAHPSANRKNAISAIFLRVGLISYSLYLVHWPLVVFYKMVSPGNLVPTEALLLLFSSLALAELQYRFVERPTSRVSLYSNKRIIVAILPAMAAFAIFIHLFYPQAYKHLNSRQFAVDRVLDSIPERREALNSVRQKIDVMQRPSNSDIKIVVVGDSHAVDMKLALQLQPSLNNYQIELFHSICDPLDLNSIDIPLSLLYEKHSQAQTRTKDFCLDYHQDFVAEITALKPDLIAFSEAWRKISLEFLVDTITNVKSALPETQILLLGRTLQFTGHPNVIFRGLKTLEEIDSSAWGLRWSYFDPFDQRIAEIADLTSVSFISKQGLICPRNACSIIINEQVTFVDNQHWSTVGLEFYGDKLVRQADFRRLLNRIARQNEI